MCQQEKGVFSAKERINKTNIVILAVVAVFSVYVIVTIPHLSNVLLAISPIWHYLHSIHTENVGNTDMLIPKLYLYLKDWNSTPKYKITSSTLVTFRDRRSKRMAETIPE